MAVVYPHYDLAKAIGEHSLKLPAPTVGDLLAELRRRYPAAWQEHGLRVTVLVNGVNINNLKGPQTPLGEEDEVWFVLPAGGG